MKKLILILPTLMFSLSTHLSGNNETSSTEIPSLVPRACQEQFAETVSKKASGVISTSVAVERLFQLGLSAKITDGLADIIDTLGDWRAIDEGQKLLHFHNL